MSNDRIAVIDLETTGLFPWRHDRVVEIGIVVTSPDGHVHTEYETLLNPNRDLGPCHIHQISAADVLRAPSFADVAGDILDILANTSVIAGHNITFDKNFLVKEYERIGVSLPEIPVLCTCHLFGRNNLAACCEELGIPFEGMPHRALSDARVTARLVSFLCADNPDLIAHHRLEDVAWPRVPALRTPCYSREHAQYINNQPPKFLQRIAHHIHHDVDAAPPNLLAYLALIDRVLEDRTIDESEEDALVEAALNLQLSKSQVESAHQQYIHSLAAHALADGIISDAERRDLHLVARLLGIERSLLDAVLQSASAQLASAHRLPPAAETGSSLRGQRVCFTGQLQCTIGGRPISREIAESLARQAGLTVASSVTKKLDILVVADPHTQSSKAKKAREYGIRILSETVFWQMIGVTVD